SPWRPRPWLLPDHLVEDLVAFDHAELHARAFLQRLRALLQVANLGVERIVACLEPCGGFLLRRELPVELPDAYPPALAEPERILQGDEDRHESERERSHTR